MKTLITCYRCGECVVRPAQAKYCLSCAAEVIREQARRYYAEHRVQCREAQHRYYQRKKNNA